ncbi:MAG: Flp pilus assembly protein CpaB [Methylococcales bacterium]|nr:Flp pilus assembly protein CpaB [Methylococcales bacterium]
MNSRFFTMLIIALILAIGAALLAKRWVESHTGETPVNAEQNTILVKVAATDIPYATPIEKTQIKSIPWPRNNVPAQAITEEEFNKDPNILVGKVTQSDFYTDQIFLKPQIKDRGVGSTLSSLIQEGMRAISVRVDDVAGVAGFILPGNKADIIATRSQGEGGTYTLLKNIKILAIDQTASTGQDKPAVVRALTLEVTPKQAEALVNAMKTGSLQFTLRNPIDTDTYVEPIAEAQSPVTPVQTQPHRVMRKKAPVSVKILPWGSQNFMQCESGGAC